jgi:hypothetical protein
LLEAVDEEAATSYFTPIAAKTIANSWSAARTFACAYLRGQLLCGKPFR